MNKPCARITLDLQQASTPTFVAVKKSDIGREIRITLSDGGFPYEISADCYAVLTGTKPDGNILYNHCDIEGNTIVYEITEQTTAAAGRMKAEVKLYGADDILVTSATFRIIIDGTVYTDDKVESSSEFSALNQLISQVVEIIQKYSDVTTVTKTSELINDSGFITNAVTDLVNYYTKTDIGNLLSNIPKFRISVVSSLPTADISETTIYLLPGGDGNDLYTEYIYADGKWEILGSQRVDLTGYATEEWVEERIGNTSEETVIRIMDTVEESSVGGTRYGVTIEGPTIVDEDGNTVLNSATVWNGINGMSAYAYARKAGYTGTEEEFSEMLANAGNGSGGDADYVGVEPAKMDRPKIFFGAPLQQTKDEIVTTFSYRSETLSFDCYAEIKAQGNSTLNWPKKNQTVKLYKDSACTEKFKVDFKGWGKQNKFVIKANWRDLTHVRDIVSVRLEGDCMRSNPDYEELPELLKTSPNLGGIDGFPVVVYAAGVYQGRYMWNIPKDKWMTNMDDELDEHCILCSEDYNSSCFRAAANINGSDWTDEIHDTVPASIKTRWNEIISFVMNSTDEEFVDNLDSHIKVSTLIDRHIMGLYSCDFDGYGKNQLYITYDGKQWYADRYDKDGTWGNYWTGNSMLPSNYGRDQYEDMISGRPGNLLFIRLEQIFYQRLQERWDYLKVNELSIPNTINRFRELYDITPPYVIEEDYASTTANGAFTGIPNKTTCTIQQIEKFVVERHAWMDEYIANLGVDEPDEPVTPEVTLVSVSATYSGGNVPVGTAVTALTGITVTAHYSDGSAQNVMGYTVTGTIAEGENTITVNYEGMTATFTVVGITEAVPCTSITLDKTELIFDGEGTQTIIATVMPSDTTDTVVWVSSAPDVASISVDGNICTVQSVSNGVAVISVTCGEYTASCSVEVSGFVVPLYPFETGVVQNEGSNGDIIQTITVENGNHINVIRGGSNFVHLALTELPESPCAPSDEGVAHVKNREAIFSLKAGDVVRSVVTYTESNDFNGQMTLFVVRANNTSSMNLFPNTAGNIDTTLTISEDIDVAAICCWFGSSKLTVDCDVKIYVNDVLYVGYFHKPYIGNYLEPEWSDAAKYSINTGEVVSGSNYVTKELVEIPDTASLILISSNLFTWIGAALYDENGTFIEYTEASEGPQTGGKVLFVNLDGNAKYARFSGFPATAECTDPASQINIQWY